MTEEQIQAEIKALEAIIDKVPDSEVAGNRIQIRAQIKALEENMDETNIMEMWPDQYDNRDHHFSYEGAIEAVEWLEGEREQEEHRGCNSMSEEWNLFIDKEA